MDTSDTEFIISENECRPYGKCAGNWKEDISGDAHSQIGCHVWGVRCAWSAESLHAADDASTQRAAAV